MRLLPLDRLPYCECVAEIQFGNISEKREFKSMSTRQPLTVEQKVETSSDLAQRDGVVDSNASSDSDSSDESECVEWF